MKYTTEIEINRPIGRVIELFETRKTWTTGRNIVLKTNFNSRVL